MFLVLKTDSFWDGVPFLSQLCHLGMTAMDTEEPNILNPNLPYVFEIKI